MDGKIFVTRSSMPPFEEYAEEIRSIWDSRVLTNSGEKHEKLVAALKEYLQADSLALCVNGHQALEGILETMDIKGEVITTPFTFVSTTNALVRKGIKPVFCDIKENDFTIDADKIESLITEKTTAILPVHVYGNICDDEKIERIAEKYNLKVIYDAAHAFGVKKNGKGIASLGDASMFSFHATKVFHTIEGGAAVFKNDEYRIKFNQLKNFGITDSQTLTYFGGNTKMNEFAAAMGLCNLRHIDKAIQSRKEVSDCYRQLLDGIDGIRLNAVSPDVESNYAYFPIIIDDGFKHTRDEVFEQYEKAGIGTRKYFYPLTSTVKAFSPAENTAKTPVADYISNHVLCLPMYEGLELDSVRRICEILRQ